MALEESEDGHQVITEEEKQDRGDKNIIQILRRQNRILSEENSELRRRIKKYCKNYRAEQDNIYNRAAGQERGE